MGRMKAWGLDGAFTANDEDEDSSESRAIEKMKKWSMSHEVAILKYLSVTPLGSPFHIPHPKCYYELELFFIISLG
ncbi:hypothetical protein VIGAN_01534200, partial [Vigna angularis var. angularis]